MVQSILDNLPEYTLYRDEGCEAAPKCLECPYPGCLEEAPVDRRQAATAVRESEIVALHSRGMKTAEIAVRLGVSLRTAQRTLKRARQSGLPGSPLTEAPPSVDGREAVPGGEPAAGRSGTGGTY
jgi:hypothetical protein